MDRDFFRLGCRLLPNSRLDPTRKGAHPKWKSSEVAIFLQEDFYDNRSFREVIAEPLLSSALFHSLFSI
jgi:hypothetical protein